MEGWVKNRGQTTSKSPNPRSIEGLFLLAYFSSGYSREQQFRYILIVSDSALIFLLYVVV